MKKLFLYLFLLFQLCPFSYGFCPPGGGNPNFNTLTGTVVDISGKPLPKIKVRIKDSQKFYITDEKGFFIFSNIDTPAVTLTFEYRTEDQSGTALKTEVLDLGNIGMQKVIFAEDIVLGDKSPAAKHIYTKNSSDMSGMTKEDLEKFQFSNTSQEEQVKAFLGIRGKQLENN